MRARSARGARTRTRPGVARGRPAPPADRTAQPDVPAGDARLTVGHLRDDLQRAVAQEGPYPKLLVDHRPGGAVAAPGLHEHRAAWPAAVDVGQDPGRWVPGGCRG